MMTTETTAPPRRARLTWQCPARREATGFGNTYARMREALARAGARLTDDPGPDDVQVHHGQPFPSERHAAHYARRACTFLWYVPMEMDRPPTHWVDAINEREGLLVPSRWNAECFRAAGVRVPVSVVPHGFDPDVFHLPVAPRSIDEPCRFLWIGVSLYDRKNGYVVEEAYRAAGFRSEEATLTLKYTPLHAPKIFMREAVGGVRHVCDWLSAQALADLYREHDCLVYPTAAEGFGMIPLEALACGLLVLVPIYSGHADFCAESSAVIPLPYRLGYTRFRSDPGDSGNAWMAYVDCDALVETMRKVVANRKEMRERGILGAGEAKLGWTWGHAARRLVEAVREVAGINVSGGAA